MKCQIYLFASLIIALFICVSPLETLAHDNTGIKVSATHLRDSLYEIQFDVYYSCYSNHIHFTEDLFVHFKSSTGKTKTFRTRPYVNGHNLQRLNSDVCIDPSFNRCKQGQMEGYTIRTQMHLDPNETYWDIEAAEHHTNSVAGTFMNTISSNFNHYGLLRIFPSQMMRNSTPDKRAQAHISGHVINTWDTISLRFNDREHDSVIVRFDSAFSNTGVTPQKLVNHFFSGGNTATMPIDSMSFDSIQHELRFRLNQTGGHYLPFMVYEYDRCTKQLKSISSNLRIFKALPSITTNEPVFDLANASVVAGNGTINGNQIYFAPTDTMMSIEFEVRDTDVNSKLEVASSIASYSSGSNVQITSVSDSLKKVRIDLVRPNTAGEGVFFVEAFDVHCPYRYAHEQIFLVQTTHYTGISSPSDSLFKRAGDTLFLCSGDTVPMFSSLGGQAKWRVLSGPAMQIGVNFGNDTLVSTWAAPTATTSYELAQERNTCAGLITVRDTLVVKVVNSYSLSILSSPVAICSGSQDTISSVITGSVNSGQINFAWSTNGLLGSDTAQAIRIKPTSNTHVFLRTESNDGCIRYAARDVILTPNVSSFVIHHDSSSFCTDDSVHLSLKHVNGLTLNDKAVFSYSKKRKLDTASAGAPKYYTKTSDETGQGPDFWPNPLGAGGSKYFRQQFIYRSSEFGFSDTILIDELNFYMYRITSGDKMLDHVEIKMAVTPDSIMSRWLTPTSLVYSDSLLVAPGKVSIPLSAPFVLAKGQHLLIEFCVSDTSSVTASGIQYSPTTFNSCLTFHDNVTSQCANRNFISWASQTRRPVLSIGYQGYNPVEPFNVQWSQTSGLTDSTGMHTSVYNNIPRSVYVSFTDTFAACTYRDTLEIDTVSSEKIQIPLIDTVCPYDSSYKANIMPSGGLYSGVGIDSVGISYPALLSSGLHKFAYTLRPNRPCMESDTFGIYINTPISVSHPNVSNVCENETSRILQNGIPSGGLYNGNHISPQGVLDVSSLPLGLSWFSYGVSDGHCLYEGNFSVDVLPFLHSSASNEKICDSQPTTINSGSPSGGLYLGLNISTSGIFDAPAAGVGIHQVNYTSNSFCSDTAQFTVRVYPAHSHAISGLGIVYQDSVNTYTASGTDTATNYTWHYGSGQHVNSGLHTRDIKWSAKGNDTLLLIGENAGCGIDTVSFTVDILENIGNSLDEVQQSLVFLKVFPIPASNELTITSSKVLTSVELYTIDMKLMLSHELPKVEEANVDVSNLPSGVYFLSLKGEWGSAVRKIQLRK